ncbi:MAG TPA: ribokinase, partial [Anaerolineales bacterium]|nr:ribokinase [Anaerolineales bacterium]
RPAHARGEHVMNDYDLLVVGSANADLVIGVERRPSAGETVLGSDLAVHPGGKGANQAVAAARLGASVSMLGRVGRDNFGDYLLENLKSNHVNIEYVRRDDAATGTAIIVVDADGQNSIVLSPGANGKVSPADVTAASFGDFRLLLLQLEIPLETVRSTAQRAKEHGLQVLLNPAPARSLPDELITLPDFLVPNETELSLLTEQTVNDIPSAERAAKTLLAHGAQTVIVTLGANGALIVTREMIKHIPPFKVDVVDTTAAGDAFIGGFASARLQDQPLEEAVRYGCACGALTATKFGAQPSLPSKEDVENFLSLRRGT